MPKSSDSIQRTGTVLELMRVLSAMYSKNSVSVPHVMNSLVVFRC